MEVDEREANVARNPDHRVVFEIKARRDLRVLRKANEKRG